MPLVRDESEERDARVNQIIEDLKRTRESAQNQIDSAKRMIEHSRATIKHVDATLKSLRRGPGRK